MVRMERTWKPLRYNGPMMGLQKTRVSFLKLEDPNMDPTNT